jgi:hypothetical protein
MSKPTFKITRSIRSEQVLNGGVEWVLKNLPSTGYIARPLLEEENLHSACFNEWAAYCSNPAALKGNQS